MYYILERGGEKIMKKRWFVVILTIGLLLHVLPLSVLALSPDPTITDSDGTILDWSDLSTVPYSLDDSQEQEPPVPDLSETGSEKSLADADNDEAPADDLPAGNPTPKTLDKESGGDDPADADRDKAAADDLPAGNLTPKTPDEESGGDDPADDDDSTTSPTRSTRSTIRTTTPHWTMQSLPRRMVIRSTCWRTLSCMKVLRSITRP